MTRGMRTAVVLGTGLVAALTASYVAYIAVERVAAQQTAPTLVPVVVASREIPLGTLLTADDVRLVSWPATSQVTGAVTSIEEAVQRGTVFSLATNEPVTEAKLAAKGIGSGLSPTITPGMRAISIKVNDVVGVAGFILPGSRVDVLVTIEPPNPQGQRASETRIVTSNVQVLTAGTRTDQDTAHADGKPIAASVVTLLVFPEDAERLALAQNEGRITLTLRNPLDTGTTSTPGAKMASLTGQQTDGAPVIQPTVARRPAPFVAPPPPPAPAPKAYTVDAIRGAKRTEEVVK